MLKKIIILLMFLLILSGVGYYVLYTQGAFQTKEDIYDNTNAPAMKCESGKCAVGKCGGN
jgi:hypothetical protein